MERLQGIPACHGFATGRAVLLDRRRIKVPQQHLKQDAIEAECARFREAVEKTDAQLQRIRDKLETMGGDTLILEAHRLIVSDPHLIKRTIELIDERAVNAEWALREAVKEIKAVFDQVDDRYFRERRSDVDFGARHLLVTLLGEQEPMKSLPLEAIVVAHELSPSDVAQLHRDHVKGFITEVGGPTSHTVIMARSLGIVAVVGVKDVTASVGNDDMLVVDGKYGEVIVQPDEETTAEYQRRIEAREVRLQELQQDRELPAVTLDGVTVKLMANVGLPEELPLALDQHVDGIGLYRGDALYLGRDTMPEEEEHFANARNVIAACRGLPIYFRTYDLGVDTFGEGGPAHSGSNPAMGLRGIRVSLQHRDAFKAQLRGLLRAAQGGEIHIMFPMISSLTEFREARAVVRECLHELHARPPSSLAVGMMVEMPSTALVADQIAREADFFAIGTNDLIQYTLGVDRSDESVSYLYRPLDPAIIRLIRHVVQVAREAKIPLLVCGEMAGDPLLALLLIGLGVRVLSMNPAAVPAVRRVIRGGRYEEAKKLARRVLRLPTTEEIEDEVNSFMTDLYPDETFASFSDID